MPHILSRTSSPEFPSFPKPCLSCPAADPALVSLFSPGASWPSQTGWVGPGAWQGWKCRWGQCCDTVSSAGALTTPSQFWFCCWHCNTACLTVTGAVVLSPHFSCSMWGVRAAHLLALVALLFGGWLVFQKCHPSNVHEPKCHLKKKKNYKLQMGIVNMIY